MIAGFSSTTSEAGPGNRASRATHAQQSNGIATRGVFAIASVLLVALSVGCSANASSEPEGATESNLGTRPRTGSSCTKDVECNPANANATTSGFLCASSANANVKTKVCIAGCRTRATCGPNQQCILASGASMGTCRTAAPVPSATAGGSTQQPSAPGPSNTPASSKRADYKHAEQDDPR